MSRETIKNQPQSVELQPSQESDSLILDNLGLAESVARNYLLVSPQIDLDDLRSAALLGLVEAAKSGKYDPEKGAFSTFAYSHIEKNVFSFFSRGRQIRLPNDVSRDLRAMNKVLDAAEGKTISDGVLALKLGVSENRVRLLREVSSIQPISINTPLHNDTGETIEDVLAGSLGDPEGELEKKQFFECLTRSLYLLDQRSMEILILYYGLGDDPKGLTQEEIGEMYGITRMRVSNIISASAEKIYNSSVGLELSELSDTKRIGSPKERKLKSKI